MSLINKLDILMKERGLNRSQLSKETGIPYTTIDGFYKKGTDNVKLSTLKKLASYFNCSLDYLVDDERECMNMNTYDEPEELNTIAAHHDSEDWTEEELAELENFKQYVLSKRNRN